MIYCESMEINTNSVNIDFEIPSYASLSESVFYVTEFIENDYNSMMQSIGIDELNYLESTGQEMVYEEGRISKLVEGARTHIANALAAIKRNVDKVLAWLAKKVREGRQIITRTLTTHNKEKIKERLSKINRDKVIATCYRIEGSTITNEAAKYFGSISKTGEGLKGIYTDTKNGNSTPEDLEDRMDNKFNDLVKFIGHCNDIKDIKGNLKSRWLGKKTEIKGAEVADNWDSFVKDYKEGNVAKTTIMKTYKETTKALNGFMKDLKAEEKDTRFNPAAFSKFQKYINKLCTVAAAVESTAVSVAASQYSATCSVVNRVVYNIVSKDKNGSTTYLPSTTSESTISTVDAIQSLFEW